MKVILKKDMKDLGKKDSMVNVSDGYAKNYLIPRGIAVEATTGNINEMKNKQDAKVAKEQRELDAAKALAAKINGSNIKLSVKSGDSGKLFGAVSAKDISDAMKAQLGVEVDKKKIVLKDPIKATGSHDVEAKLHPGVVAKFCVVVEGV
jgi:large subunit ribosomal protein L9